MSLFSVPLSWEKSRGRFCALRAVSFVFSFARSVQPRVDEQLLCVHLVVQVVLDRGLHPLVSEVVRKSIDVVSTLQGMSRKGVPEGVSTEAPAESLEGALVDQVCPALL